MSLRILKRLFRPAPEIDGTLPDMQREPAREDVAKACARLFSTDDGAMVLDYLKRQTFMRSYGTEASDSLLRFGEGQRALVAQIMRLIAMGKSA